MLYYHIGGGCRLPTVGGGGLYPLVGGVKISLPVFSAHDRDLQVS